MDIIPQELNKIFLHSSATQRVQTYTGVGSPVIVSDDVFLIYQISYGNYCMVGMIIGVVVGIVVSLLTEPQDLKTLNSDLIAPVLHRFLPKNCKPKKFKGVNSVVNYSVSLNAEFKPKNYNSPKLPDWEFFIKKVFFSFQ